MKGWSGMRTPMRFVPGLKLGFRSHDLSRTTVTGPGSISQSNDLGTFTLLHLDKKKSSDIFYIFDKNTYNAFMNRYDLSEQFQIS